ATRAAKTRRPPASAGVPSGAAQHTTAIWNGATVDDADRLRWLTRPREAGNPVLVAVDEDDAVLGYATYGPWRDFDGYARPVEHSVYVHRDARGGGIGRALVGGVIDAGRARGTHRVGGGVDAREPRLNPLPGGVGVTPGG
ncbi:N-acetyltransferase family protein, partial [Rothia kristinae]